MRDVACHRGDSLVAGKMLYPFSIGLGERPEPKALGHNHCRPLQSAILRLSRGCGKSHRASTRDRVIRFRQSFLLLMPAPLIARQLNRRTLAKDYFVRR